MRKIDEVPIAANNMFKKISEWVKGRAVLVSQFFAIRLID